MKINVNDSFKRIDGLELTMPAEGGVIKNLTIKDVCVNALLTEVEGIVTPPTEKVHRFTLSEGIYKAESEVELKAEDVVLLKNLVGHSYGPLIVGQFYRFIGE